jgi:hypothetical protein
MNDDMVCGKCKFWDEVSTSRTNTVKVFGECKIHPPKLDPRGYGCWPIVPNDEYCHKWQPLENKKVLLTEEELRVMSNPDD